MLALLTALTSGGWPPAARADDAGGRSPWRPDRVFVQGGLAPDAWAATAGLIWSWRWRRPDVGGGTLTGYWEVSAGRWASDLDTGGRATAWVTQVGVTPVIRWTSKADTWFAELGIGANWLMPIYRSGDKQFSTAFNFGDHLGFGRRFGDHHWSLRIQHFSNAGIRRPNPGENFLQLRYSRSL